MKKFKKRKLSDNELSYQLFRLLVDPTFKAIIDCKIYDVSKIQETLDKTLKEFQELNCKIEKKNFIYDKKKIFITNLEKPEFNGNNFECLSEILNKSSDDLLQVYCIHTDGNNYFLIFIISHSLMDGKGFLIFLDTYFRILNNQKIKYNTNCYISDMEFIKQIETKKEKRNLYYNNKLKQKPIRIKQENQLGIRRVTINKNISFLLTKIITILNEFYENDKLTYLIPTSIRHFNSEIISLSNLTEPLYFKCNKNDDWYSLSKKMFKQINNKDNLNIKNIDYGMAINISPNIFKFLINICSYFQIKTNKFLTAGSITSLKMSDYKKYNSEHIIINSIFLIPFYQPLIPFSIEISESNDRMEIIIVYNKNYFSDNNIDYITQKIKKLK